MITATLFGATELAEVVAARLQAMPDVAVVGCVAAPPVIAASFAPNGRTNLRHVDLGAWAEPQGIPHHRFDGPAGLRTFLHEHPADVGVVAGWYHMIPQDCLDLFRAGAVGFHASLLPQLRGAAPLNWAILSGADGTGMSLFKLGAGVDDGPLIAQQRVPIGARTTVAELIRSTTEAAVEMLDCLLPFVRGELAPVPQQGVVSYGLHRAPEDGCIDWRQSAEQIDRLVRAVGRPYAGAFTFLDGVEVVIWSAQPLVEAPAVWSLPGGICRLPGVECPLVVTGNGLLMVEEATDRSGGDVIGLLLRSGHRRLG